MKKLSTLLKVSLLAGILAMGCFTQGCVSSTTTTTRTPVVHPDGTITTNVTEVIKIKGQDPLKDKAVKITTREKGLHFKIASTPGGTTGALSPLDLFFGMSATTIETLPVYAGVLNGYTPPVSFAGASASSLWNDAENSSIATAPGLNPSEAYYASTVVSPNILQPITVGNGQVLVVSNTVPIVTPPSTNSVTTNAPATAAK